MNIKDFRATVNEMRKLGFSYIQLRKAVSLCKLLEESNNPTDRRSVVFTEEMQNCAIKLRDRGASFEEIAHKIGVCYDTFRRYKKRNPHIPQFHVEEYWSDDKICRLISLKLKERKTSKQIAREFNYSHNAINGKWYRLQKKENFAQLKERALNEN